MTEMVRLRRGVAVEPLVDGWPAWLLTMDPITSGFLRIHHLAILSSYVARPERHARASADARLAGGPFSDLDVVDLQEVIDFATWYEEVSEPFLEFATQLDSLHCLLAADPRVLPWTGDLPPALRGRVEVLRSDEGFPAVRVLRGPSLGTDRLSCAVWRGSARRPSFGATPRLAADPRLEVVRPDPASLRRLAALAHLPMPVAEATSLGHSLGIDLADLVEPAGPVVESDVSDTVRFLGHASVSIDGPHGRVVTDPVPPATSAAAHDLSRVRCVLLSHGHPDHFSPEALLPLVSTQPMVVVPRADGGYRFDASLADALRYLGFTDVREVVPFEAVEVDSHTEVVALPFLGEHGGLPIHGKSAYRVVTQSCSVVVAADATGLDPLVFEHESTRNGTDLLCIGIEPAGARVAWLYGPLLTADHRARGMGDQVMAGADAEEVRAIRRVLGARRVAIYGTGAPGMEHILGRAAHLLPRHEVEAEHLRAASVEDGFQIVVLDSPGQSISIRGDR